MKTTKKNKARKRAKVKSAELNFTECPQCKSRVIHDEEHCLDYCTECGLITRASIEYVGLRKAQHPYHILII